MNGTELKPGDCFRYTKWDFDDQPCRKVDLEVSRNLVQLLVMPTGQYATTDSFMLKYQAIKLSCDACPNTFECLARGAIKDV